MQTGEGANLPVTRDPAQPEATLRIVGSQSATLPSQTAQTKGDAEREESGGCLRSTGREEKLSSHWEGRHIVAACHTRLSPTGKVRRSCDSAMQLTGNVFQKRARRKCCGDGRPRNLSFTFRASEEGNDQTIHSAYRDGAAHESKGAGRSEEFVLHRVEGKQSESILQVEVRKVVFSRGLCGFGRRVGLVAVLRREHRGIGRGPILRSRFQWLRAEGTDRQ
jgi:hypothetical protein